MVSTLIIAPEKNLQAEIRAAIKPKKVKGFYIATNKNQASAEKMLAKAGIDTSRIFFIDTENVTDRLIHIPPGELDTISDTIKKFIEGTKGKKYILVEDGETLLLYNKKGKLAKWIKQMITYTSNKKVDFILFTHKKEGLTLSIFNFFEDVKIK